MLKIMIIDNNLTFGQILADILKTKFSSSVMSLTGSGPDLLDQFRMFSPDIVFMDIQSMGTTCFGLTKGFKASHRALRIIWITSYDQPEYLQKAKDCGVDYCLSKNSMTTDGIIDLIRVIRDAGRIGE
jgi:Response regulator containing a CheY-like receiver domain and an HTH DNA-binding domain